jgi:signal transduction histidine kinase
MLFIADPKTATRKDMILLHALPTAIVFIAFLGVTIWSWQTTKTRVATQKQQAINQEVENIESRIDQRMDAYQQILESANGLFMASASVDRAEWRTFYENYDIPNRYPGLQGISYAEFVPKDQLEAHQSKVRAEGYSDYGVTPAGDRGYYVPITYTIANLTPENYKTVSGFGFDIATDPVRNQAVESAIKNKDATLTGKLALMTGNQQPEPAFIMYQPLYRQKDKAAIAGFAYAPFTANNLFEGIFGDNAGETGIGFRIYDQEATEENILFENSLYSQTDSSERPVQRTINVAGRNWIIEYKAPESIVSQENRRNPTATLIAGVLFSALIAGLVLSLLLSRTRSLAFAENKELQRAKDDLLSIASHQLRTPATGVKQYVGMLREGYAGKVPRKQKQLLDEAYNSNERQLAIIDEILHVARIDTGRLVLNKERLAIRKVVDQILREQTGPIKERSQRILTKFPKKILYAFGDSQYIHMAIDNILSNAIKYTPEKGVITIQIKRQGDFVCVSVTDTGVGIDKKDLDKLFQKFSRIPNELSRQTAGSGVGLYIAKQIIDLHGGSIEVTSTNGKGTTFAILLPLATRNQQKGSDKNGSV